jgi:phenylacetate-CoA ligase
MPLINYELGDSAVAGEDCPCGRGFPTLRRIEGRVAEVIRTFDGRVLAPSILSGFLLEDESSASLIVQYQAEQLSTDRVVLRLVPRQPLPPELTATLRARFAALLGPGMTAQVEVVDRIPELQSGKRLIIKSRLPE